MEPKSKTTLSFHRATSPDKRHMVETFIERCLLDDEDAIVLVCRRGQDPDPAQKEAAKSRMADRFNAIDRDSNVEAISEGDFSAIVNEAKSASRQSRQ